MRKFLIALGLSLPLACQAFVCFAPSEPYCVRGYSSFGSQSEYDSCKRDVEDYLEQLKDYVQCVIRTAQDKQNQIIDDFNRQVQNSKN